MIKFKTIYCKDRNEWRTWLQKNHLLKKEAWLVYYKKASGKPRIPYNNAVEEALCYGWIDSIVKGIDDERFAQRFTPRRPKSVLSEMNKERIRRLIKRKKMTKAGLKAVEHAFDHNEKFKIPKDIVKEIKKNKQAWKNFQKMPEGYIRVRRGYILAQGRHSKDLYKKSLNNFIKMIEQ